MKTAVVTDFTFRNRLEIKRKTMRKRIHHGWCPDWDSNCAPSE